jgi:hypothetical protein
MSKPWLHFVHLLRGMPVRHYSAGSGFCLNIPGQQVDGALSDGWLLVLLHTCCFSADLQRF